jgi:hypothetical protein
MDKQNKEEKELMKITPEVEAMYRENADLGAENLGAGLPLLKIHTIEKSQNTLANGKEPNNGWFFYTPTQEQFETINCHILSISRGYRAEGYNERKDVFHQILSGVITNQDEPKPFMMYFTGLKLTNLWEFGKEASPYTKQKPTPIPMFVMNVKLSTEKIKHSNGTSWVVKFEILKEENGKLIITTDAKEFLFLREGVIKANNMQEDLISKKSTEQNDAESLNETETDYDIPEDEIKKLESQKGEGEDNPF